MSRVLLTTAYFPPFDYLLCLYKSREIVIEAWENYPKQSYRNRTEILAANGPFNLVVPVKKTAHKILVTEAEIDYGKRWTELHWRAVMAAYGSSPYFEHYADDIRNLICSGHRYLFDLNMEALNILGKLMKIPLKFTITSEFEKKPDGITDLRNSIHPKKPHLFHQQAYMQVFCDRFAFEPHLGALDLLFNMGPGCGEYLKAHLTGNVL